jgi:hypothetical protein
MKLITTTAMLLLIIPCLKVIHPPQTDPVETFFQQLTKNGGQWEAPAPESEENPFSSFLMTFSADGKKSVRGSIRGIKHSGDTLHLWDIWEFPDPTQQHGTVLIQRSDWAYGVGTSDFSSGTEREGELEFKWYNNTVQKHRDTHRFIAKDTMISISTDLHAASGEWSPGVQLTWIRK